MQRSIYLVLLFLFIAQFAKGQFGVSARYNSLHKDPVNAQSNSAFDIIESSMETSLHYWFRLKNRRIEFFPGIGYLQTLGKQELSNSVHFTSKGISIDLPVHIYVLQLEEDCNCPTFGKKGSHIEKGLFFIAQAQGQYVQQETKSIKTTEKQSTFYPQFSVGIGYDIGISDFFTISPKAYYNIRVNDQVTTIDQLENIQISEAQATGFSFGLHGLFRFDYRRRY